MIADPETIVCGLADGRVDVYSRTNLTRYSVTLFIFRCTLITLCGHSSFSLEQNKHKDSVCLAEAKCRYSH